MANKTIMVAQREFMENMRTKTFWVGILVAPIGIVLFYALMFLLRDQTDVRKYAILDLSESAVHGKQWLSKAVESRVAKSELGVVFKSLQGAKEDEKMALAERLRKKAAELPEGHAIKDLLTRIEESKILAGQPPGTDPRKLPPAVQTKLTAITAKWMFSAMTDAKKRREAIDFVSGLAMKDYVRVDFDPTGEADPEKRLKEMLQKEEIFAYFVIGKDPLAKKHGSRYVSNNVTDQKLRSWFARNATEVIRDEYIQQLKKEKGLAKSDIDNIRAEFQFAEEQVSETGENKKVKDSDKALKYAPIAFVYVLWLSVFIAASMLLTNTVEEKSNRIIEVLLSSVSPVQLMHGKIYGIALTGLTVVGSWALFLFAGVKLAPKIFPSAANDLAKIGLDQIVSDPLYLGSFLVYFVAGYLFYAAILVAIGSVCNSLKEAQNLQQPVMFALFVPLATMVPIATDPNGKLAQVITYIPLYTPFAMMNRAGGPPPLWEWIVSSGIIVVSVWIAFRGAAKVFRVGVLMTGKPPKIGEIIRWVRAPVK